MLYNYDFEIAALVIMGIICIHFLLNRQYPSDETKMFRLFLLCSVGECMANIGSCLGIVHTKTVPYFLNQSMTFLFFLLESVGCYLFFRYTLLICDIKSKNTKWIRIIGDSVFGLDMMLTVLTPFTGFFFYFEHGKYVQGVGADLGYFYVCFFLVMEMLLILLCYRKMDAINKCIICCYTVGGILAILFQFVHRDILMTSFARTLVIVFMYLAVQNPHEYSDIGTQAGNEKALLIQMNTLLKRKSPFTAIIINISKNNYRDFEHVYENECDLKKQIGDFLCSSFGRYWTFRFTSDTFCILLKQPETVDEKVGIIQERFKAPWIIDKMPIVANSDIFILDYPKHFTDFVSLRGFQKYLIEQTAGRVDSQRIRADDEMKASYDHIVQVEMALDKALKENSLQVYYQPIYSVEENRISCLEALVRLQDEKIGFISPDEFIGIAEKSGRILSLGMQVFEECCRFMAKEILPHKELGIQSVHINVSVVQCMQPDMADQMIPIIKKYDLPPGAINLEITEKTAISIPELMHQHMKRLRKLGVTFSLDDYGTGNSNCSYLIDLPFQKVKFDRNMIWSYFEKETAHTILQNEFHMLKKLGIPIVAEGIEERLQYEALKKQGIEYIQGYYFGRPLPKQDCIRFIQNYNENVSKKDIAYR